MIKNLKAYFIIWRSGLFDKKYYLKKYPDVRKADIDPLIHFVNNGWKEGRNPSESFDIEIYLLEHSELKEANTNPLVHYIKLVRQEKLTKRPTLKGMWHFVSKGILFFLQLRGIVFFAGYPYPEREKDGYYQRIRSVDTLFADCWRIYIDSVKLPGRESWYNMPAPKTLVLRPNIEGYEKISQFCVVLCIIRCKVTYFHSILSLGRIGKIKLFWQYPWIKRILDLHGVVPEEFSYQGDQKSAQYFDSIEQVAINSANYIIVVTDAMRHHIEKKYSGSYHGQFITLPIFQGTDIDRSKKPYINKKPLIIYAGGLQKWQQVPKMIDAISKTVDLYLYRFYCPEPKQVIAMLPEKLRHNPSVIVESKNMSELIIDYQQCHYGFILREDIIVNQVACPTKLIEYLAMGIVPIVDCENIGDFKNMGMKFIHLDDLLNHQLPDESKRKEMASINYSVYQKLLDEYNTGVEALREAVGQPRLNQNKTKRKMTIFQRAQTVAKEGGLNAVIAKLNVKVKKKIHSLSRSTISKQKGESNYRNIYSSYLSVGQNEIDPEYIDQSDEDLTSEEKLIKLIAFYLPQYHPIPENDSWWGRGFTEWANVSKAVPDFVGHYQPHLPRELGFYDLRIPEVQQRQVELAKKFGISGFCFYYYWFNGKKLLEKPLDQFVSDKSIDFSFCLCWANENWTRRWDGLEEDVLIAQEYSEESDIAFMRDIEKYIMDERYIRICNRPVLMVYRSHLLPNPGETAKRWRQYCKDRNMGDIYLIAVQTSGNIDPRTFGFDAAVEFPPHGLPILPQIQDSLEIVNDNFEGAIFEYQQAAAGMMKKNIPDYPLFKTVITSWDNTARRQNNPLIFHGSTPKLYQKWLTAVSEYTLQHAPEGGKLAFINAWNEWAEGAHLEPDRKFGYAYLQATANVIKKVNSEFAQREKSIKDAKLLKDFKKRHDTAVVLHIYYPELWDEIAYHLNNLTQDFDLFVSIPQTVKFSRGQVLEKYPQAFIYNCPNRGRDIGPFIKIFGEIDRLNYQYICKIHTKKSTHRKDGDCWRKEIFDELLGSKKNIQNIKSHLDVQEVGIIGPKNHLLSTDIFMGGNAQLIDELADRLNLLYWGESFNFVAGSMFWCRPESISPILRLGLKDEDFSDESGKIDGTLAHAIERLFGLIAYKQGYKVLQTGTFTELVAQDYQFANAIK
jgi:lipopolysaccharide biosynthesis protein